MGLENNFHSAGYAIDIEGQVNSTWLALVSGGLEPFANMGDGKHSPFAKAFIEALQENNSVIYGTRLFSKIRHPVTLAAE